MPPARNFSGTYLRRSVDTELDDLFSQLPAVLLDGPKGVGKTATALRRVRTVRRLDVPSERTVIQADPDLVALDKPPVLIDEWQRVPEVWDAVRRSVDEDSSGGRFLLTGSAPTEGTHSGAGRIVRLRMRPFALHERKICRTTVSFAELMDGAQPTVRGRSPLALTDYVDEILASGFPGLRGASSRAAASQLDGYLDNIVDRDLPEAGFTVRRPATVQAWLRAYAAATSTAASWEKIRDASTSGQDQKPGRPTTDAYTELLTALRILDPVEAWLPTNNHLSRLTLGPKHHLADPALAARLLGRTRAHLLTGDEGGIAVPRDGTLLGGLFESLAALSIRTLAQTAGATTHHLRTRGGEHEVDLILERNGAALAMEVKLSGTVNDRDVRHLLWLRDALGADLVDAAVVTTGPEAYRRSDGIAVIPLGLLGP